MDLTTVGIFIGLFLTGIIAGIPIGQAFEHRRLLRRRQDNRQSVMDQKNLARHSFAMGNGISKEELDDLLDGNILEAREIS